MNEIYNLFDNVIANYTRNNAIKDGVLIDVSETALKLGFIIPVAVTRNVWDTYILWTDEDIATQIKQDQESRLWDVLWMLYTACLKSTNATLICYNFLTIPRDGVTKFPVMTRLKSTVTSGDMGEPVITIMLPSED